MIDKILLQTAEPDKGSHLLQSFLDSYRQTHAIDFKWDKQSTKVLSTLFGNSPALSRYIINHPDSSGDIVAFALDKPPKMIRHFEEQFLSAREGIIPGVDTDKFMELLRRFKYSILCSLGAKYLLGKMDSDEFCSHWSMAAEKCCQFAYDFSYNQALRELGEPYVQDDDIAGNNFMFAIIALGKLGAGELNLSSDIDLLFIYNSNHGYIKGAGNKTLGEFAAKIAITFSNILSRIDQHGFCFRVDTDLRPEGKSGPIAQPINAASSYYEYWGEEWERMMLIRANPVAGDVELGNEFLARVRPFVYRRSWDMNSLQKIKALKTAIQQEAMKSSKEGVDIKRGEGGIREVEFVVQSIQLLHGGRDEKIISRNTFRAIDMIGKTKHLPPKECDKLKSAYKFLRHLENMLQLPEEKQTHVLPTDHREREALAVRMGYNGTSRQAAVHDLLADFDEHTGVVKHHFQYIFQADFERQQMEEGILTNISTCENDEEEIDSLPWFKREETKRIQYLDLRENLPADQISEKLSLVAEVIISEAYKIASRNLRETYGPPLAESKGHPIASLAIVGMGKLGGREIDYTSDLDLMFIYSETGSTSGPKKISNQEYFTRLSQRVMSLISIPTRYGRAYQIDTDLRPSGRAGILVSSLGSFKNYHHLEAQIWERQALLKARPVAGDPKFCEVVSKVIGELCYQTPTPADYKHKINELRLRIEKEKAKETDGRYNIKHGYGSLMDIETLAQYMQLKYGGSNQAVRTNNTLTCLKNLSAGQMIEAEHASVILENYQFLRRLLSRVRLFSNHAVDFIDAGAYQLDQIAISLGFENKGSLINEYLRRREEVRQIYNRYMG